MKKKAFILFENNISPEEKLQLLKNCESRKNSWYICEKEFAPILEELRKTPPPLTKEAGIINSSSGKYVWKLEYLLSGQKRSVAYKTNPGKTPHRYIFRSSLPIREMRNYLHFEKLNIPVANVIAAGDERKNFILQETFILTEFLENCIDGRSFMPGGCFRAEREKLLLFCRMNLELLAKLHSACFFHKAFHPRNLLWREKRDGALEVFWIDVARCRKISSRKMSRAIIFDLHTFFHDMCLTKEETFSLVSHYAAFAPKAYIKENAEGIFELLTHFRRRLFSKRKYGLSFEENK